MNVFMTTGTHEFLSSLQEKHRNNGNMILMQNDDHSLLLHETNERTVFSTPRKYEVIDQSGELVSLGFVVMNNIPVTDEGRPLFEHRFKNRQRLIENEPGFQAIRVLRPIGSNTYVILTIWTDEEAFKGWQDSQAYAKQHANRGTSEGIDANTSIFAAKSYVTKYTMPSPVEEE